MRAAVLVLVLALARVAGAAPTASAPLADEAHVLDPAAATRIEADLLQLAREGLDIAVILVRRTGEPIETYARAAAQRWTSDHAEMSRAALLVLAIDDRASRIEVNDALRPRLPDRRAQTILDNVRGYLRTADYATAVGAIVGEIGRAARGEAPDLESPHPQSDPAATPAPVSSPTREPASYRRSRDDSSIWLVVVAGVIVLGIGAAWAAATRKGRATLSHDGTVAAAQRSFVLDWLWCTAKVIGWVGFVVFIIAAAAAASSASSSSSSWSGGGSSGGGSSSGGGWSGGGGGGGSSGGGGWSGGGASSSW